MNMIFQRSGRSLRCRTTLDQLYRTEMRMRRPVVRRMHTGNQDISHSKPSIIFSGIQPTGLVHLGNYLGAIRNWTKYQDQRNCTSIYCIVDMHSITLPYDHTTLPDCVTNLTATLIACGIDPTKCILYQQSKILEHANLAWILTCLSTMPRLSRFPQFKDKSKVFSNQGIPVGLFLYPILQTADILLYKTTHVPVGEDQVPHIQLARDMAMSFNRKYGETFPLPDVIIDQDITKRIRSLRDPSSKMSKSDKDPKSRIDLLDSPDTIREHLKKAITDNSPGINFDPENRPGVSNLMTIYHALTETSYENIEKECEHLQKSDFKNVVADVIIEHLKPVRTKALQLLEDRHYLTQILREGSERARTLAHTTLKDVYCKIGF